MNATYWSWLLTLLTVGAIYGYLSLPKDEVSFGATEKQVATLQDEYFAKEGKYLQVLEGGRLPHYEEGNLTEKLGVPIDSKYAVDVYENERGKGYRIRWEDATTIYSVGYGVDAKEYTYTITKPLPIVSATST